MWTAEKSSQFCSHGKDRSTLLQACVEWLYVGLRFWNPACSRVLGLDVAAQLPIKKTIFSETTKCFEILLAWLLLTWSWKRWTADKDVSGSAVVPADWRNPLGSDPRQWFYNIFYHTRTMAIIDRPEGFELFIYSGRWVSTQEFSVWGANSATAASP